MLTITSTTCGQYNVTNSNEFTVKVNIFVLGGDGQFTNINMQKIISAGGSDSWTLPDGEYYIEEKNNSTDEVLNNYKLLVACALKACFTKKLQEWLCRDVSDCGCEGKDTLVTQQYKFVSFIVLVWAYLSLANKIVVDNWIFTVLGTEELADIVQLKTLREKLEVYCLNC